MPGPYTFVLEASRQVPKILQTRRRTVGIRVPDHPIALGLVGLLGHPIITTTAALPDEPVESDPYEIEAKFKATWPWSSTAASSCRSRPASFRLIDDVPEVIREGKGDVSGFVVNLASLPTITSRSAVTRKCGL